MSDADRELLKTYKPELLTLLAREPFPPCPHCGGPTHDAAKHAGGIIVLLCDDAEGCRWGLAMTEQEYRAGMLTRGGGGIVSNRQYRLPKRFDRLKGVG